MGMDELKQYWAVKLEEKHEPFTVIGGQRGGGKIFFLENAVKFLEEQLKEEKAETERWKSAALYYADKLGSVQKWIPISERLPEPWKWILCYCEAGNIEMLRYDDFIEEWGSINLNRAYKKDYVTHWMPLPEPPKGD